MVMIAAHPQLVPASPTSVARRQPALRPISPALRHWILGRDGYQCRAPGCDRQDHLEVHHVDPALPGGRNNPANLVAICQVCRPMWDLMGRGPFIEEKSENRNMVESPTAVNL